MNIDIVFKDGQRDYCVKCVAVSFESGVLHVYPTYESWMEGNPIHCLHVKSYVIYDESIRR